MFSSIPHGKGFYGRDLRKLGSPADAAAYFRGLGVKWIAQRFDAMPASVLQTYLDAMPEIDFYAFTTPEGMRPETWREDLDTHLAAMRRFRMRGILVDAESGWPSAPDTVAAAFADELDRLSREEKISVGITTYPAHPRRKIWARPHVWVSPQVYQIMPGTESGSYMKEWITRYKTYGYAAVVPSLTTIRKDAGELRLYHKRLPAMDAFIYWPGTWPIFGSAVYLEIARFGGQLVIAGLVALAAMLLLIGGIQYVV